MNAIYLDSLEIKIPSYLTCLSQERINALLKLDDLNDRIIASGVDPKDGKVVLILASGIIMLFDGDSYYIPRGRYIPNPDGKTVFLSNENGRWPGTVEGFNVESAWIIAKSVSALKNSELFVNDKSFGTFEI